MGNKNTKTVVVCESFGDKACECGFCCNDGYREKIGWLGQGKTPYTNYVGQ